MTEDQRTGTPDPSNRVRVRRWMCDAGGPGFISWAAGGKDDWQDKWAPPCPDGRPQTLRRASGFRERSVRELELRVALGSGEGGVCQVVVDELEDEIHVLMLIHCDGKGDGRLPSHHHTDGLVRIWLDTPLGERAVIDVDSNEEVPLYTPMYLNNVPQADHGQRPARRPREGHESTSAG